jgi:RNA 2',3'-cyclic 3'-phosphodiesterase
VGAHGLFFALQPDPAAAARIAATVTAHLQRRGQAGSLRPTSVFHITLHQLGVFEGALPEALVATACRAAAELNLPAFDLSFERLESFGGATAGRHPLVLTGGQGLEAVRELRDALGHRMAAHGLRVTPSYTPHLTVRYDAHPGPATVLELPGWVASEFVLLDSPQGLTQHRRLAGWALQA